MAAMHSIINCDLSNVGNNRPNVEIMSSNQMNDVFAITYPTFV